MKGVIFVISSPTGAGKTTICDIIQSKRSDVERVITHTTRKPREGEKDGVDYHFVSMEKFTEMIKNGEFVEYAIVHQNYYGTSKKALFEVIERGKNPILAIDVQGAKNIMNWIDRVVSIFILPPSFDEWIERLQKDKNRNNLDVRLKTALSEYDYLDLFEYCIVNDCLDDAVSSLESIIDASKLKLAFYKDKYTEIANKLKQETEKYLEG